ncbi:MAG: hypothetical protein V4858_09430 [Pseudomonadota bacterium]
MNLDQKESIQSSSLQSTLALGWLVLLVLFLAIVLSQLMQAAIDDDFTRFSQHPGRNGWMSSSVLILVYGLMPLLTRLLDRRWFRWLNVVLLAAATAAMMKHQAQHMLEGMTYGLNGLVDVAHHAVGVVLVFLAIRWARVCKTV